MPDTQNLASGPIERIDQVRRFDIIKLLEQDSTRLFHRGDKTHAADLAQAALFLRQGPIGLIGGDAYDSLCTVVEKRVLDCLQHNFAGEGIDFEGNDDSGPLTPVESMIHRVTKFARLNRANISILERKLSAAEATVKKLRAKKRKGRK